MISSFTDAPTASECSIRITFWRCLPIAWHPGIIFINDLDAGVECILIKTADDTELRGAVDSQEGQDALQRELFALENWTVINGMKVNKWVLHLGCSDAGDSYRLGDEWLESSSSESVLMVLVTVDNMRQQCALGELPKGWTAFWDTLNTE